MIYWLTGSTGDHPALAAGLAPDGLLHPAETARLERLRVPKRRRDWLLGRWTAKRLVQGYLQAVTGDCQPLDHVLILADPDGAPYAAQVAARPGSPDPQRMALEVSISHSQGRALCALCAAHGAGIGADIERIEPRERSFVETFFAPAELAQVDAAAHAVRDTLVTALWSGKEAALKALRLGLRVDTRRIICRVPPFASSPAGWTRIEIEPDRSLTEEKTSREFRGWWLVDEGFVLTLALTAPALLASSEGPSPVPIAHSCACSGSAADLE